MVVEPIETSSSCEYEELKSLEALAMSLVVPFYELTVNGKCSALKGDKLRDMRYHYFHHSDCSL